eukprot:1902624-Prymnesium_polylepis.1
MAASFVRLAPSRVSVRVTVERSRPAQRYHVDAAHPVRLFPHVVWACGGYERAVEADACCDVAVEVGKALLQAASLQHVCERFKVLNAYYAHAQALAGRPRDCEADGIALLDFGRPAA